MSESQATRLSDPLGVNEIEFRVQSINKGGFALIVPYKNARCDMRRLDETYGTGYWQRKHEVINGNLFCSVGIFNKDIVQWVWVQDVGTESSADKEKGQASDSFKRACFNLGIGRELYEYPVISIKLNRDEFTIEANKGKATWELQIKEWAWYSEFEGDSVSFLAAKDNKGDLRFKWGERKPNEDKPRG